MAGINEFTEVFYSYRVSEGGILPISGFPELAYVKKVYQGTNADTVADNPLLLLKLQYHFRHPAYEFFRYQISKDYSLGEEVLFIRTTVLSGFMFNLGEPNFEYYTVVSGSVNPMEYIRAIYLTTDLLYNSTKTFRNNQLVLLRDALPNLYQIIKDFINQEI